MSVETKGKAPSKRIKANFKIAVGFDVASAFCFATYQAMSAKLIADGIGAVDIILYRSLLAVMIGLLTLLFAGNLSLLKSSGKVVKVCAARALVVFFANYFWISALLSVTLTDAVALHFTMPLITSLLAIGFLKEKLTRQKIYAVLVGFLGVLVILSPKLTLGTYGALVGEAFCLIAATLWAGGNIMTKTLSNDQNNFNVNLVYINGFALLVAILMAGGFNGFPFDTTASMMMVLIGGIYYLTCYFQMMAYVHTEISSLQPYAFTRMIFMMIYDVVFFAKGWDIHGIIGGCVVFLSGLMYYRGRARNKNVGF
jgi:drug/metabolite transporter (DMT)-like permease